MPSKELIFFSFLCGWSRKVSSSEMWCLNHCACKTASQLVDSFYNLHQGSEFSNLQVLFCAKENYEESFHVPSEVMDVFRQSNLPIRYEKLEPTSFVLLSSWMERLGLWMSYFRSVGKIIYGTVLTVTFGSSVVIFTKHQVKKDIWFPLIIAFIPLLLTKSQLLESNQIYMW